MKRITAAVLIALAFASVSLASRPPAGRPGPRGRHSTIAHRPLLRGLLRMACWHQPPPRHAYRHDHGRHNGWDRGRHNGWDRRDGRRHRPDSERGRGRDHRGGRR